MSGSRSWIHGQWLDLLKKTCRWVDIEDADDISSKVGYKDKPSGGVDNYSMGMGGILASGDRTRSGHLVCEGLFMLEKSEDRIHGIRRDRGS
jgi:hypothetical protein